VRRVFPQITLISLLIVGLLTSSFAQSPAPQKRKKIKDFGSSLKRSKPDPQKNAATEQPAPEGVAISEGDVIRVDTSLVNSDLLVLDPKGNAVPGLTAADFQIRENGVPQTVAHFFLGDNVNVPRTIVLIIDYACGATSSLGDNFKAAKVLVDKLGPRDLMAIVTDDVEMVQDFTSDKKKLKQKLTQVYDRTRQDPVFRGRPYESPRYGRNKQFSALMATLKEAFTGEDIRPIIIFQTNGAEAYVLRDPVVKLTIPEGLPGELQGRAEYVVDSIRQARLNDPVEFSLDDVYRTVEKSRVTIYTVVPNVQYMGLTPDVQMAKMMAQRREQLRNSSVPGPLFAHERDLYFNRVQMNWEIEGTAKLQSVLAELASLTGGWTAFLEKPEQANEIYSRIFTDINQRYILGYYPTDKKRDGKRRMIDIQVKGHPEYQILGRLSYFAPKP
jgi:VWFA-related protein